MKLVAPALPRRAKSDNLLMGKTQSGICIAGDDIRVGCQLICSPEALLDQDYARPSTKFYDPPRALSSSAPSFWSLLRSRSSALYMAMWWAPTLTGDTGDIATVVGNLSASSTPTTEVVEAYNTRDRRQTQEAKRTKGGQQCRGTGDAQEQADWSMAARGAKLKLSQKLGGAGLWIPSSTSCPVPGYLGPSARRRLEAPGLRLHRIEVDARFRVSRRILPDWVTSRSSSLVAGN
ncbi:hypothetical protein V8C35DRAFT_77428 [Trichoderma chlorosporum]